MTRGVAAPPAMNAIPRPGPRGPACGRGISALKAATPGRPGTPDSPRRAAPTKSAAALVASSWIRMRKIVEAATRHAPRRRTVRACVWTACAISPAPGAIRRAAACVWISKPIPTIAGNAARIAQIQWAAAQCAWPANARSAAPRASLRAAINAPILPATRATAALVARSARQGSSAPGVPARRAVKARSAIARALAST